MGKVNDLERQVQGLSTDELAAFRRWFAEFDAEAWDRQFEGDAKAGKLDPLAERARQAHAAGKSSKFRTTSLRRNFGPVIALCLPKSSHLRTNRSRS